KDVMLGTPQYISPEQGQGVRDLDQGTDIYSFGVLLYEIVVGRVPFNADTPFSIIHDHIYTPLPLPTAVNPKVPEVVERVLLKSLAKDRKDRFEKVEQQIQAFRAAVLEGEGAFLETLRLQPAADDGPDGGASAPIIPNDAVDGDGAEQGKAPRKRWPWIAVGLLISVGCLLAFLGSLGGEDEPPELNRPIPSVELMEDDVPGEPEQLNPDSLFRHAESLVEGGRDLLAAQEFLKAGDLFMEEGDNARAAESYLRAVEVHPSSVERNRLVEGQFTQAIFLGSAEKHFWPLIEKIEELYSDWPVLAIAQARQRIFAGAFDEARELINMILEEGPENPLALAVLAEYYVKLDEFDAAERIITRVLKRSDELPPWLAEHFHWLNTMLPE
ncbi:MAG: tetratricopeptide repeat protein, partial [Anaerolineales bacterium]|nr:tetratricopeptide repeat protein [Anaerolineales bacterium]